MTKRKGKEKATDKAPVKVREMTPAEQARYEAYKARKAATPEPMKYEEREARDGVRQLTNRQDTPIGFERSALTAATGTVDVDAGQGLINQAGNAVPTHSDPVGHADMIVSMMTDIAPGDGLEGMLAAQMVTCHNAAMDCMRRAHVAGQTFEGRKLNLTFADRFLRTFTAQVETLAKYRGKGQQKVTVEHVHVHQGGQAIVGNVTQGGGGHGTGINGTTSSQRAIEAAGESLALRSADGAEVWGALQEHGETVPATRDAERAL